jgi:hypothetical protein
MRGRHFPINIVSEQLAAYRQQLIDMAAFRSSSSSSSGSSYLQPGGATLQQLHDEAIQQQKRLVEQQQRRRQHLLAAGVSQDMGWQQQDQQQQQQQQGMGRNGKRSSSSAVTNEDAWQIVPTEKQQQQQHAGVVLGQPAAAKRQKLQQMAMQGMVQHGSEEGIGAGGFHVMPQQQLQQRGLAAARRTSSDGSGNLAALAAAAAATDAAQAGCSSRYDAAAEANPTPAVADSAALAAAKAAHTSICACVVLLKMVPCMAADAHSMLDEIERHARSHSAAFVQAGNAVDSEALQVLLKVVTALTELHLVQQSSAAAAVKITQGAGSSSESNTRPGGVSELVACLRQSVPEGYSPSGASCTVLELLVHCWVKESQLTGCKVDSSAAAAAAGPIAAAFATDAVAAGVPGLSLNCSLAGLSQLALNFLVSCCRSSNRDAAAAAAAAAAVNTEVPAAAAAIAAVSKRMIAVKVMAGCAVLLLHWPEGEGCKLARCVQAGLWRQRLLAHADGHGLGQFQSEVASQLHGFLAYLTKQLG